MIDDASACSTSGLLRTRLTARRPNSLVSEQSGIPDVQTVGAPPPNTTVRCVYVRQADSSNCCSRPASPPPIHPQLTVDSRQVGHGGSGTVASRLASGAASRVEAESTSTSASEIGTESGVDAVSGVGPESGVGP